MTEHIKDTVMAAPPVSVGALTMWGVPLSEWILLLTAVYTVFLIIDKLPAVLRTLRDGWRFLRRKDGRN